MISKNQQTKASKLVRQIISAGIDAVSSRALVANVVRRTSENLTICDQLFPLDSFSKIAVVGAGKAGAGMCQGFTEAVGGDLLQGRVGGWVNVPENCVQDMWPITIHAARPAAVNEPRPEGVDGARNILRIVSDLRPDDLCVVLLSGGASALLPAPVEGITLAEKQQVTKILNEGGADIVALNTVRKQLSRIKGGGLGRAITAGRTIVLIISDVIGDPLDVIASGPTVGNSTTAGEALQIIRRFDGIPQSVRNYLQNSAADALAEQPIPSSVSNYIIGNNEIALQAAKARAEQLGLRAEIVWRDKTGEARRVGEELAEHALRVRKGGNCECLPVCLIGGGEPTVTLAKTDKPRRGGRNQEAALGALARLWNFGMDNLALGFAGTDGEDGPTAAAGAIVDAEVLSLSQLARLKPLDYLAVNDSNGFFSHLGQGLFVTGPTQTNVMDIHVMVVQ